jgi:hypothetical protein
MKMISDYLASAPTHPPGEKMISCRMILMRRRGRTMWGDETSGTWLLACVAARPAPKHGKRGRQRPSFPGSATHCNSTQRLAVTSGPARPKFELRTRGRMDAMQRLFPGRPLTDLDNNEIGHWLRVALSSTKVPPKVIDDTVTFWFNSGERLVMGNESAS